MEPISFYLPVGRRRWFYSGRNHLFFAYNWEDLPKFAKLGIVQTLLVASVLLTIFTRWNVLIKQIILTGATFLVGTLFAVFGQIYQTGADAYDLFLGWTLFTILWAVAIRFTPLWLTFIGLLCTTIWLYVLQIVSDNLWAVTLLTSAVTWICALTTVITEWMSIKELSADRTAGLSACFHWQPLYT